jgi:hypothetical protein
MDDLKTKDKTRKFAPIIQNRAKKLFWQRCGEDDLKRERGRVDAAIKTFPFCPVMMTDNTDVPNGQANGTTANLQQVVLKPGEATFQLELSSGTRVPAVFASQVQYVTLKHQNDKIIPQVFKLETRNFDFKANIPVASTLSTASTDETFRVAMKGRQVPFVSNTATTGHKLQGATLESIFVNDWRYDKNWAYVVLSRVTTMCGGEPPNGTSQSPRTRGLFIRQPLDEDLSKYEASPRLKQMLRKFKAEKSPETLSDEDYAQLTSI